MRLEDIKPEWHSSEDVAWLISRVRQLRRTRKALRDILDLGVIPTTATGPPFKKQLAAVDRAVTALGKGTLGNDSNDTDSARQGSGGS